MQLILRIALFTALLATRKLFACEFSYINYGKDLIYICNQTQQKVLIKEDRLWIDGKVASKTIQDNYRNWKKSKQKTKKELKNQKDTFNCR